MCKVGVFNILCVNVSWFMCNVSVCQWEASKSSRIRWPQRIPSDVTSVLNMTATVTSVQVGSCLITVHLLVVQTWQWLARWYVVCSCHISVLNTIHSHVLHRDLSAYCLAVSPVHYWRKRYISNKKSSNSILNCQCWARSWCWFLGSQPAGDISRKLRGRLPLLSTRPTVTFPAKLITPVGRHQIILLADRGWQM